MNETGVPPAAFSYRVYGVRVRSALELFGAGQEGFSEADIRVSAGLGSAPSSPAFVLGAAETTITVPGRGALRVLNGQQIEFWRDGDLDDATLATFVSGAGLAMALHQRGAFVLHGSCILVGGAAVCLVGPGGAGKSTLTAALLERGHALLSDGMTVLQGLPAVACLGAPQIKLWPDAAKQHGYDVDSLPRVTPHFEKRVCSVRRGTDLDSALLKLVLIVEQGSPVACSKVSPAEALMGLVRNSFLAEYADHRSSAALLDGAAKIATTVRVLRIKRGDSLGSLPETVSNVEKASAN